MSTKRPRNQAAEKRRPPSMARKDENRELRPRLIDPNQLYSPVETQAALDISRQAFWDLLSAGRLQPVRLDSRVRIRGASIIALIDGAAAPRSDAAAA